MTSQDAPAWRRRTRGEHRWPATLAVVAAVVLQLLLPDRVVPQLGLLLPLAELALLAGLVVADPLRIDRESTALRRVALALLGLVVGSAGWSVLLLVRDLVSARPLPAGELLASGGGIWLTTVLAFALLYWELDRGGPAARAAGTRVHPDLLFVQMQSPEFAPPEWEPRFPDYLYLAYTNATAFSPTDVLPLTRRAKTAMAVQSAIALVLVLLVLARAVNALT
ncbi:DUF1345 domain-containing protein [Modestobacter sp. Leaf380]|uniref:DUF1345 domain-containing protein n=1 Tax=Modestobacter sp. Leaf380 TaxID=1736356 RepID=UPI0006F8B29A|nr:DUF1345 domain-containing protein [Modestobacter sp. Leaf380]KQS71319.1 hypothetical protein ASG41_20150 [Modestobacter sp. Leaf380]